MVAGSVPGGDGPGLLPHPSPRPSSLGTHIRPRLHRGPQQHDTCAQSQDPPHPSNSRQRSHQAHGNLRVAGVHRQPATAQAAIQGFLAGNERLCRHLLEEESLRATGPGGADEPPLAEGRGEGPDRRGQVGAGSDPAAKPSVEDYAELCL